MAAVSVGGGRAWPPHTTTQRRRCGGHGRGVRGRRQGLTATHNDTAPPVRRVPPVRSVPEGPEGMTAVSMGGGRAWPPHTTTQRRRCGGHGRGVRGRRQGLAGLRADAPSEARGADGERAGRRPRAHTATRPEGQATGAREHRQRHKQYPHDHPGTPKGRVPKYPPLTQPRPRRGSG